MQILTKSCGKPVPTFLASLLDRHPHRRAQAAHRAVAERDVAAMRARDVACDREAEAGVALVLIARVVEAQERPEHFLAHLGGNTRSVVIDADGNPAMVAVPGDGNLLGE